VVLLVVLLVAMVMVTVTVLVLVDRRPANVRMKKFFV
jgi:hypothetical protein